MRFIITLTLLFGLLNPNLKAEKTNDYKNRSIYDNYDDAPKPYQRYIYGMIQRAYPNETIPDNARKNALLQLDRNIHKFSKSNKFLHAQQPEWRVVGPFNIGGRIRSIAVHPTDPNTVWIAAASGGIWKSTDGGGSWDPKFDFQNTASVGAIVVDPNNPDILLAGTGEGANTSVYSGTGLYKSTDGGDTWNILALADVSSFNKIHIHPSDSDFIVAGGFGRSAGLWISTDGGNTWENKLERQITDVSIDPNDKNRIVCGVSGGIYITSNGGNSFSQIAGQNINGFGNETVGRVSVQMVGGNANIIFALMERGSEGYVYKSLNGGSSWSQIYGGPQVSIFGPNNQGWYDNVIQPDPSDANNVIVGGIDIYRSTNGTSFSSLTQGGNNIHVDQHCVTFAPSNPDVVYAGNDGGIYKSTNGGSVWFNVTNGLAITQFYGFSVDQTEAVRHYGGTQDNSSLTDRFDVDNWNVIWGGDGFETRIELGDPNIVYGQSQYAGLFRANFALNQTISLRNGLPPNTNANFLFGSPLENDPNYEGSLYVGGKSLYFNFGAQSSGGGAWQDFGLTVQEYISSIEPSKTNEVNWFVGTSNGELYYGSENQTGGVDWVRVGNGQVPQRFITDIETSPNTEELLYVTLSGFGTEHIYRSSDNGTSWASINNNLPDVPVNQIEIDKENENIIYLATDIGVFVTYNQGGTWLPFGRNLPRVQVSDLEIHYNENSLLPSKTLRIATYGRSIWEVDIPSDPIESAEIITPIGGEVYVANTNARVTWQGFTPPIKLEISKDDGQTWQDIQSGVEGNAILVYLENYESDNSRFRISSETDPSQVKISNSFAVRKKRKGSILQENVTGHTPYGIALDTKGFLWSTSFYTNELFKYKASNLELVEKYTLKYDSLYTDITIDESKNRIYISKLNSTSGGGGRLEIRDYNDGSLIEDRLHPFELSTSYPIGTTMFEFSGVNYLLLADRDGNQDFRIVETDNFSTLTQLINPCQRNSGPRGLAFDGDKYVYHVCMDFGGGLTDASLIRLDKQDLTMEVDRIKLENSSGLINARGCAYDPADDNVWVSDFVGNIYKLAGFNTVTSIEDNNGLEKSSPISANVFPNPATEYSNITFDTGEFSGELSVKVIDMLGNDLGTLFDGNVSKNSVKAFTLNVDNYTAGMYNLMFVANGDVELIKKLIVVK